MRAVYRKFKATMAFVFVVLLLASGPGTAQEQGEIDELKRLLQETQDSMQRMMEEHQRQMDSLQIRIEELEQRSEDSIEKQEEIEEKVLEQAVTTDELRSGLLGQVSLHGYYDVQYLAADSSIVDSFVQNELSIFLRHATEDDKWTFFSEIEFELFDSDDFYFSNDGKTTEIEIETAWLEYRILDAVRLRAGKLLLPQYWQTYHYPNLTLSTRPPSMVGSIFPKNIIGVEVRGDVWFKGNRGFSYVGYLGNGGDSEITEVDRNDGKAIGGRVTLHLAKGGIFDTFDVSGSGFTGKDEEGGTEKVVGFDTQIRIHKFELLSEFAFANQFVDVPDPMGGTMRVRSRTDGYYVQLAYNFVPKWHVFYRFDDLDQLDRGVSLRDAEQHTIGVNFRPRAHISLKLELFRALLDGDRDSFNGLASSVVYNF